MESKTINKSILVLDTPNSCRQCKLRYDSYGQCEVCILADDVVEHFYETDTSPDWCPLSLSLNGDLLKLYLLTQTENSGYDTFNSCIVAAYNEEEAKSIHPFLHKFDINCLPFDEYDNWKEFHDQEYIYKEQWKTKTWASSPENVTCRCIGIAQDIEPNSVLCSSFNAG